MGDDTSDWDGIQVAPPVIPCPYCETSPEYAVPIDVLDDSEPGSAVGLVSESAATPDPDACTFTTKRCLRYYPCGHAFTEASLDAIAAELRDLRALDRERRRATDPERLKALLEYEIPAKQNAVRQARRSVKRIPRADLEGDDD